MDQEGEDRIRDPLYHLSARPEFIAVLRAASNRPPGLLPSEWIGSRAYSRTIATATILSRTIQSSLGCVPAPSKADSRALQCWNRPHRKSSFAHQAQARTVKTKTKSYVIAAEV